jgi:hypothetical protein
LIVFGESRRTPSASPPQATADLMRAIELAGRHVRIPDVFARVGLIDRSHLGPISLGVVVPTRARPLQGQA